MANQQTAAFYDEVWQRYAHLDAASPASFHRRRLIAKLAAETAPGAGEVLDVGCGQGELLGELGRRLPNARLSGADVSEQSLSDSRRRSAGSELFALDLTDSEFDKKHRERLGRYDLVVCSEVLEHIADHELAARRLLGLLKPGGSVIVTVPGGKMSKYDRAIGHERHYRAADLRVLLEVGGFENIRVLAWGFPFHTLYRTAVRVASRVALPTSGRPTAGNDRTPALGALLGRAYSAMGAALKPLFYLNTIRRGEQMFAVACRPA